MINYNLYIHSKEWEAKKLKAYQFHGLKCKKCGKKTKSHVHHITYERLGEEKLTDLIILCEKCHSNFHKMYGTKLNMEFETTKFLQKEVNDSIVKHHKKSRRSKYCLPTNSHLIALSRRNIEKEERLKQLRESKDTTIKVKKVIKKVVR